MTTFLEVVCGLFLITFVLLAQLTTPKQLFTAPSLQNWAYLGLAAITGFAGGNYFSLVNLKWGGESLNSLLSPAITATVVLFSVLTDRSLPSFTQICGIILTLGAVVFFLWFNKAKRIEIVNRSKALWSGLATVGCISATIIFSVKGSVGNLSIFHTLWLRLLIALPFVTTFLLFEKKQKLTVDRKFYLVLLCAVAIQTIAGSWLWFAGSFKIGLPLFQTLVATLPFWVYAVDVYVLRRSKPSRYFLITALAAVIGVWLVML